MARNPKGSFPRLTAELIEKLAETIRQGCYVETAVALCGISKQTFYRWLKEANQDGSSQLLHKLSDAVEKALADAEMRDLAVITEAAKSGQWQASAWRLERRFPEKWGRMARVQVEHSGPEGRPIEVVNIRETLKQVLSDPEAFLAIETLEAKLGKNGTDQES